MTTDDTVPQQIAVITGASKGIGAAFANLLADKGYRLVLVADKAGDLAAVAEAIQDRTGERPGTIAMDLSAKDAAKDLLAQLHNRAELPDLLINNAGFGLLGETVALDADEQAQMINLNISALTELSVRCGKLMADKGSGGIINVSSVAGMLPGPKMAVYYASKAYILSFTEALSEELKGSGVIVAKIRPGMVITEAVIREARDNPEYFEKSRSTMNKLVDTVETVAPFLVDRILDTDRSGVMIRWLTGPKMAGRFAMGLVRKRPDQFEAFGL